MSDSVRDAFEKWWNERSAQVDINSNQGEAAWLTWQSAAAAADAEWRSVVEMLVGALQSADALWSRDNGDYTLNYDDEVTASYPVGKAWKLVREALAQAQQLLGKGR